MTATTTLPSSTTGDQAPRPLPLWASIPIILACLTAGGYIIHWYVGTHLKADEAHILGDVPARPAPVARVNGGGRNPMAWLVGNQRSIRPAPGGRDGLDAVTEHARANYIVGGNGRPNLNLNYGPESAYAFVPEDVRKTIYAARRLVGDHKYTDALKLSATQVEQLRQRSRAVMQVSPADRTLMLNDFTAYRTAKPADRKAAQDKLLADLDGIADRSREPTRQAMVDAAVKINAIITPDQWTQLKGMGLLP